MNKLLAIMFLVLIALGGCSFYEHTLEIVSIERNSEIEGSFFLGCGGLGNKTVYYTYAKYDNSYYLITIPAMGTPIIETDEIKPHYEFGLLCEDSIGDNSIKALEHGGYSAEKAYRKLYVPVGTIVREFKL